MVVKNSAPSPKKEKNIERQEDQWNILSTILSFVKDFLLLFLEESMKDGLALLFLTISTVLSNFTIFRFKSLLKNNWNGGMKWAIIILVYASYTIIPFGARFYFQEKIIEDFTTELYSNHVTQTVQAEQINKSFATQDAMQTTIDFQSTQLITPTPKNILTTEELVVDTMNEFENLINNGQALIAYDTLFTDNYRNRNTQNEFVSYWGTLVDRIRFDIEISPQINASKGVSETTIEIFIYHDRDTSESNDFIWKICHYEIAGAWLMDDLNKEGNCWKE